MLRLALAAAALALGSTQALPTLPLPPPGAVDAAVTSLAAAVQEPGRLADAYASARNAAAAQQWADAAKRSGAGATTTTTTATAAAAAKPLVAATAQAQTGSPNPTAKTVVVDAAVPADPVEAVVHAGADAVSGRAPPSLAQLLAGPAVAAAAAAGGGERGRDGGRRLLQQGGGGAEEDAASTAGAADAGADAAPAKPTMSKYKLFKTADPHRGVAAGIASILPPRVALPALPGR